MMAEHDLILAAVKGVVLVLGFGIAGLAYLGYRRGGDRLLLFLSLGFALIAFGSFVEGLLFQLFMWELLAAHTVESAFVLVGLAALAVLLRPRRVAA